MHEDSWCVLYLPPAPALAQKGSQVRHFPAFLPRRDAEGAVPQQETGDLLTVGIRLPTSELHWDSPYVLGPHLIGYLVLYPRSFPLHCLEGDLDFSKGIDAGSAYQRGWHTGSSVLADGVAIRIRHREP